MRIVELKRVYKKDTYTIGKLYIDGEYFCDTCEDKDRGLKSSDSLELIQKTKVYGKTAIPTGAYEVVWSMSSRFKKVMPELKNVKGWSGVRIHSGNTAEDSLGCILLGENKIKGGVTNSRNTIAKFEKVFNSKEPFTLIIS